MISPVHCNPFCRWSQTIRFNLVNAIDADAQAPCIARSSTAMILNIKDE